MSNTKIARIACPLNADGEFMGMSVGSDEVVEIKEELEDLGTYQIKWYVAYDEAGDELGRMNALSVQTVVFREEVNRD